MQELSTAQARRTVLAAQGFFDPPPTGSVTMKHMGRVISRVGLFQIDSVNVLARSHYIPAFSRLGPYATAFIDDLAYVRRGLFEYWGHEASLLPMELFPYMRWKMDPGQAHPRYQTWAAKNASLINDVIDQVKDTGPIGVSDLKDPGTRQGPWWGWADGKTALEWLFLIGAVTTSSRRNFERLYDITERVVPDRFMKISPPDESTARKHLLALAARSSGVGTAKDISDYYRLNLTKSRALIAELVEEGVLKQVRVQGWKDQAFLSSGLKVPRGDLPSALVCPFDPLVWERSRTERLFGMRYRIEIYVPAPQRIFGYYVLPFLCDGELAGRVDLKADRKAGALLVQASHIEPGHDQCHVAERLDAHLRAMARWLELEDVKVVRRGNLSSQLARSIRSSR